ncbi:MAG: hypothetical protein J6A96_03680 [Clostridia bacterium]|nr:hypothetical protein [Clostridia bacterium]
MVKKLFFSLTLKTILLTFIPIVYSALIPLTFVDQISQNEGLKTFFWSLSIFLIVLHIILIVVYCNHEQSLKKDLKNVSELNNELLLAKKYISFSNKLVLDNTNKIYDLIKTKKEHSDIIDWDWLQAKGDEICLELFNLIHFLKADINLTVNMMFKKKEHNEDGYTMLSRKSDDSHTPKSYRHFISSEEASGFYYKKVMDNKPTKADILMNKKEIQKEFTATDVINYSQYIAIPIACKGNKIIGIIQIITYDDTVISRKKAELNKLCNDYFYMASTLMLLSNKSENLTQII